MLLLRQKKVVAPKTMSRIKRRHSSEDFWQFFLLRIAAVVGVILLIVSISYKVRYFKDDWLDRFNFYNPSQAPARPVASPSSDRLIQGSFSDSFSGVGWEDSEHTTVARDNRTMVISFPLKVSWTEMPEWTKTLDGAELITAKGNGKEIMVATRSGNVFLFHPANGRVATLTNRLPILEGALTYDAANSKWILLALDPGGQVALRVFAEGESVAFQAGIELPALSGIPASQAGMQFTLVCDAGMCLAAKSPSLFAISNEFDKSDVFNREKPVLVYVNLASGKAESISLPASQLATLAVGGGPGALLVGATKSVAGGYSADIYKFTNGKLNLLGASGHFDSEYLGVLHPAYNPETKTVLALYNAYFGQAVETQIFSPDVSDKSDKSNISYSRYLSARLLGTDIKGEVAVDLEPFAWGGTWWAGSFTGGLISGSRLNLGTERGRAVILRLRDGLGLDLGQNTPIPANVAQVVPGGDEKSLLVFFAGVNGIEGVYRLTDQGFVGSASATWTSVRINSWDRPVMQARIYRADDRGHQNIRYYLSNDGGKNWQLARPGELIDFPTSGNDLRYRIELSPSSDPLTSPWVTQIGVEYWLEK